MRESSLTMIGLEGRLIDRLQDDRTLDEIEGMIALQYRVRENIDFVFNAVLKAVKPDIDKRRNTIEQLTQSLRQSEHQIAQRRDSLKDLVQMQRDYEEWKEDDDF